MRLDHIAYRVKDRNKTAKFFKESFGYTLQEEFEIKFEDGSTAKCIALEPPEKLDHRMPFKFGVQVVEQTNNEYKDLIDQSRDATQTNVYPTCNYHLAPEIFISDGESNSIVGKWVEERGGVGGVHHLAYQVSDVTNTMKEWRDKGYAEFTTKEPLRCEGVTQVFTKPSELTGVIYEFIERSEQGFCKDNVKDLMESTKNH